MNGLWLAVAAGLALASCRGPAPRTGSYSELGPAHRDEALAAALVEDAGRWAESEPERSEALLRRALDADLFHAKAHNNLGVLLLAKGDLYQAAAEFEWARKLLPGHPEPRLNLAITLEQAGQLAAAAESYRSALEVYPGYVPAIQGAARLALLENRRGPELDGWLEALTLSGESEEWRVWAREQLEAGRGRR